LVGREAHDSSAWIPGLKSETGPPFDGCVRSEVDDTGLVQQRGLLPVEVAA
jgi:hypothetical protein